MVGAGVCIRRPPSETVVLYESNAVVAGTVRRRWGRGPAVNCLKTRLPVRRAVHSEAVDIIVPPLTNPTARMIVSAAHCRILAHTRSAIRCEALSCVPSHTAEGSHSQAHCRLAYAIGRVTCADASGGTDARPHVRVRPRTLAGVAARMGDRAGVIIVVPDSRLGRVSAYSATNSGNASSRDEIDAAVSSSNGSASAALSACTLNAACLEEDSSGLIRLPPSR